MCFQTKPDHSKLALQEIHPYLFLDNDFVQAWDVLDYPIVKLLTCNCCYLNSFCSLRLIYDFMDEFKMFYAD